MKLVPLAFAAVLGTGLDARRILLARMLRQDLGRLFVTSLLDRTI